MLRSIQKIAAVAQLGQTMEVGSVRIHRYSESFTVTDLTWAGKRGKKVDHMSVGIGGYKAVTDQLEEVLWAIEGAKTFDKIHTILTKDFPELNPETDVVITRSTLRGVDVTPGGFKPVTIVGKKVSVEVGFKDFVVKDLESSQENRCIPSASGGVKAIPAFYRWVQDNESKIKGMTFQDILKQMHVIGVEYHSYCAID